MFYTLGTAAKVTGKSKGAVLFSIRKGRISAKKDELGRYQIDPAELARIYPITQLKPLKTEQDGTQETVYENRELKARLEGLQRLCLQIEGERDSLREHVSRLTALLPVPKAPPVCRPWWRFR